LSVLLIYVNTLVVLIPRFDKNAHDITCTIHRVQWMVSIDQCIILHRESHAVVLWLSSLITKLQTTGDCNPAIVDNTS